MFVATVVNLKGGMQEGAAKGVLWNGPVGATWMIVA